MKRFSIIILVFMTTQGFGQIIKPHLAYLDACKEYLDSCKKHLYLKFEIEEYDLHESYDLDHIIFRKYNSESEGNATMLGQNVEYEEIIRLGKYGWELEIYNVCVLNNVLKYNIEGISKSGDRLFSEDHSMPLKDPEVKDKIVVSSHLDSLLGDFQKRDTSMIQFFCGKEISQIELLAFFRDFLRLSKDSMCQTLIRYNLETTKEHNQNVRYIWKNNLCLQFSEFLKNSGGGECLCNLITTNRNAINAGTSSETTGNDQCTDYKPWTKARNYELNDKDDMIVSYGRLGAFKGVGFLAHYDGGGDSPDGLVVKNSGWSSVSFRSVCVDPITQSPDIANCSACRKKIELQYYYKTQGLAYAESSFHTDGNRIWLRTEDWAMLTVQNGDQIDADGAGAAYAVTCNPNHPTFAEVISGAADLVNPISAALKDTTATIQIPAIGTAVIGVFNLIESVFFHKSCNEWYDSDTLLLQGTKSYTLEPGEYFQAVLASGWAASGKVENNGRGFIVLNSDGYMAAVVNTEANEDGEIPDYCECEKMASYVLGSVEGYDPATVNELTDNPPLLYAQTDIFDNFPDGNFNLKRYVGDYIGSHGPWDPKWTSQGCCSSVDIQCQSECAYIAGCDRLPISLDDGSNLVLRSTKSQNVTFFPNPFEDAFTLNLGSIDEENLTINIYNIDGRLAKSIPTKNLENVRVDTKELVSGTYILSVSGTQNYYQDLIVKQ